MIIKIAMINKYFVSLLCLIFVLVPHKDIFSKIPQRELLLHESASIKPVSFGVNILNMKLPKLLTVGQKYNRLTILNSNILRIAENKHKYASVICDCGVKKYVRLDTLLSGRIKSCGCLSFEIKRNAMIDRNTKHGLTKNPLHRVWCGMISRTKYKYQHTKCYHNVDVCNEWKNDFMAFYEWAINNGYKKGLQIDRIDYMGNYEPYNCRFVTPKENNRNKSNNRLVLYKTKTLCISEWCEIYGVDSRLVRQRMDRNGWSFEKAISTPTKIKFRNKIHQTQNTQC